jgi:hypothetical protein
MRPQRAISNSSLAFIDVMSCGLGAVILLFVILDFNSLPSEEVTPDSIEVLDQSEINGSLRQIQTQLQADITEQSNTVKSLTSSITQAMLEKTKNTIKRNQMLAISEVPEKYQRPRPQTSSGQLIGMTVKGPKILIAFDTSASMADEKLINIIMGISDKSGKRLAAGKKWAQAKRTLIWTIKNAPKDSQIQVISYSETVRPITSGWVSRDTALKNMQTKLVEKKPDGGTSLGKMLEYVTNKAPGASDIYLITDGLPTISGDKRSSLASLKSCYSLSFNKNTFVSGECREQLFYSAVKRFQKTSAASVNTILLALEGDPKAAPLYWKWSAITGGVLFSPRAEWPLI